MTTLDERALEASRKALFWLRDEVDEDTRHVAARCAIEAYLSALPPTAVGGAEVVLIEHLRDALTECRTHIASVCPGSDQDAHRCLDMADAALSALYAHPPAQGWRDIETAPKDGTRVLLAKIVGHPDHDTALWWVVVGHWSDRWNNWNDGVEPSGLADPTHWLPVSAHGVGTPAQGGSDDTE